MKLSKWNTYIPLGIRSGLVYNSFTDSYVVVKSSSDDFAHAVYGEINFFSKCFFNQMVQAGALVDENLDEIRQLEDLIREIDNDDSNLLIIVNPTLDCNFHCWYCYENHVKDSCMTQETRNSIISFVKKQVNAIPNLKMVNLSFFGGEPLLKFDEVVRPLIEEISALCETNNISFYVHFTTNAYLFSEEIVSFLKRYNSSYQITLDGGRANHNNTRFQTGSIPSFDVILNNIRLLTQAGMRVNLRINYTNRNLESTGEIVEIVSEFPEQSRSFLTVDYQRVWQDYHEGNPDKINDMVETFKRALNKVGIRTADNRHIDHVRCSCYGDKRNELLFNYNGDVFACTARNFTSDSRLGKLKEDGLIEWNDDVVKERQNIKFKKAVCHDCAIAPRCGGGCRTKCIENRNHENCNFGYSPQDIEDIILDRFEKLYMHKEE